MSDEKDVTPEETVETPVEETAAPEAPEAPEAPVAEEAAAEEAAPEAEAPVVDEKEMEEGKVFAILGYILPILCLIPLIQRNNAFSLFHGKQVLVLWLSMMVISLVNIVPCLGQIIWAGVAILVLVLDIMGLVSAIKGEMKPLPIVGGWAADWFKGITKIES